jgi:biopolymer transport protein TolQ
LNTGSDLDILMIIWESGAVVKLVLLSLIIASVISWAIVWKKRKTLKELSDNNKRFLDMYIHTDNLRDLSVKSDTLPFSPYKEIFSEGYSEYTKIQAAVGAGESEGIKKYFRENGTAALERSMKKGVNSANRFLDKHLSTLASIGSVSPFVGLFGTVWGIIGSFRGLAAGGATLDAVAPGIAEALVATAVGLFAAIPAVWFYNHYNNVIARLNNEMESFGQDFLNLIERSIHK